VYDKATRDISNDKIRQKAKKDRHHNLEQGIAYAEDGTIPGPGKRKGCNIQVRLMKSTLPEEVELGYPDLEGIDFSKMHLSDKTQTKAKALIQGFTRYLRLDVICKELDITKKEAQEVFDKPQVRDYMRKFIDAQCQTLDMGPQWVISQLKYIYLTSTRQIHALDSKGQYDLGKLNIGYALRALELIGAYLEMWKPPKEKDLNSGGLQVTFNTGQSEMPNIATVDGQNARDMKKLEDEADWNHRDAVRDANGTDTGVSLGPGIEREQNYTAFQKINNRGENDRPATTEHRRSVDEAGDEPPTSGDPTT